MMDPISGISFAASIVQLVHFSIVTAKTVHEISQRGSSSDTAHTKDIATQLSSLTVSVQKSLQDAQTPKRALTKDEKELIEVGKKCENIATKLQKELEKLEVESSGSKLSGVKIVAMTILKKGKIEKMMDDLEGMRRVLETGLLVTLRFV